MHIISLQDLDSYIIVHSLSCSCRESLREREREKRDSMDYAAVGIVMP